jgi:NAD(P)-dependent dehydrogenase (short-subunit alcohol dehydrogenase family)
MTVMRALRCFEFPVSHTMNRRGKPEQLAVAIEFLLSEDAGLIAGQSVLPTGARPSAGRHSDTDSEGH